MRLLEHLPLNRTRECIQRLDQVLYSLRRDLSLVLLVGACGRGLHNFRPRCKLARGLNSSAMTGGHASEPLEQQRGLRRR